MIEGVTLRGEHLKFLRYWVDAKDAMHRGAESNYGKPFADTEQEFYEELFSDPDSQRIEVVIGQKDSVCNLCERLSNQSGTKFCSGNGSENDRAGLAETKLEPGSYTLSELISRLRS